MGNPTQESITLTLSDGTIEEIPYVRGMGPYEIAECWACNQQLTAHQQKEIRQKLEKHPKIEDYQKTSNLAVSSTQWNEMNFDLAQFRSSLEAKLINNLGKRASPKKHKKHKKPKLTGATLYHKESLEQLKQSEHNSYLLARRKLEMSSLEQDPAKQEEKLRILKHKCKELEDLSNSYTEKNNELKRKLLEKSTADDHDHEHQQDPLRQIKSDGKKIDSELESKIIKLLSGDSDSSERKKFKMIIDSVQVKFYTSPDVDAEQYSEAFFKINESTTFSDIKAVACEFWNCTEEMEEMCLSATNHALLDLYSDYQIYSTILSQRLVPEFFLSKKGRRSEHIPTHKNDCFVNEEVFSKFTKMRKDKNKNYGRYSKKLYQEKKEEIERLYKGLKEYKQEKDITEETKDRERERIHGYYGSFVTFLFILVGLFSTMGILIVRRNVNTDYWLQSSIHSMLLKELSTSTDFFGISSPAGHHLFMKEVVSKAFFKSDFLETDNLLNRFHLVGPVRVRQVRSKKKENCERADDFDLSVVECFHTRYDENTQYTEEIPGFSGAAHGKFQDEDSTKIDYTLKGEFGDYDGSGYVWDIPGTTTLESYLQQYKALEENNWLDRHTRAVFISANLFALNYEKFIPVLIMLEGTPTGFLYPSKLAATVIRVNVYNSSVASDVFGIVNETLRLFVAFYFVYLIVRIMRVEEKGEERVNWWYLLSFPALLDLLIIVLVLATFGQSLFLTVKHSEIFGDEYYELQGLSGHYIRHLELNAWVLLILLFRLITIFNISQKVHTFLRTLELASTGIMFLLVIITPLLLGLLIIAFNIWGPFLYSYRALEWSILSAILFTLGYGEIRDLLEVSQVLTIGFFLIYFFVIVFFMFSAFLGILIDAYQRVKLTEEGLKKYSQAKNEKREGLRDWVCASFTLCRCRRRSRQVNNN